MIHAIRAGLAAMVLTATPAFAETLTLEDTLGTFNLVTNSYSGNQEVEGRTYIGSTVTGVTGQFGFAAPNDGSGYAALTIDGDAVNSTFNQSVGSETLVSGSLVNSTVNNGSVTQGATNLPVFDFSILQAESLTMRDLDQTTQANLSDYNNKVFGGSSVVNVDIADLSGGGFSFDFSHGGPIIINVSGEIGSFGMNALGLSKADAARVIWNFYEATEITVNTAIFGHVLATNAAMYGFSGSTEGTVIADAVYLTNGELHQIGWADDLPYNTIDPVPLPAGGVLLLSGPGVAALLRRRRG